MKQLINKFNPKDRIIAENIDSHCDCFNVKLKGPAGGRAIFAVPREHWELATYEEPKKFVWTALDDLMFDQVRNSIADTHAYAQGHLLEDWLKSLKEAVCQSAIKPSITVETQIFSTFIK